MRSTGSISHSGRWRLGALLLAAPLLAACGGANPDSAGVAERDSAGIRIVENARPSWSDDEVLTLAPEPSVTIGAGGGIGHDLSRVAGAARLADGRIVVADGGSVQLRFYDPAGAFLNAVGGRGGGPGELDALLIFQRLAGDTLAVISSMSSLSLFDGEGGFVHRMELRTLPLDLPGIVGFLLPLAGRSYLLGSAGIPPEPGAGERWLDSMPLALLGPDSVVRHRLGRFPAWAMANREGTPQLVKFGPSAAFAAADSSFFWGIGTEYSIGRYSPSGRLERLIRRRWSRVPVRPEDIDRFVEEAAQAGEPSTGAEAEREKREMRDAPYADAVPAFSQMLVDREGRLWVRQANLADATSGGALDGSPKVPSVWSVFDGEGRWLGDVTMPARFSPRDIGTDYVLGVARDALDVQTVVQYPLRTSGPTASP